MEIRKEFYFLVFLFFLYSMMANAATIHGSVYDSSLIKINNVEVTINSSPRQMMVANNGTYSFKVENGFYYIGGFQVQKGKIIALAEENATVSQNGDYVIDLILFPEIDTLPDYNDAIEINDTVLDSSPTKNNLTYYLQWPLIIILAIVLCYFFYFILKNKLQKIRREKVPIESAVNKSGEVDYDIEKILDIIKKEDGRTTQKEIRKQVPLSEAKISLMIAELEHKGLVEKIKKGRGNIIILKKK